MRDWLHDDDKLIEAMLAPVFDWAKEKPELIGRGWMRREVHPVEGPILRVVEPEDALFIGLYMRAHGLGWFGTSRR